MSKTPLRIGYIGLGKMGKNMVLHLLEGGIDVVAWNRSPEPRKEVAQVGAEIVDSIEQLVQKLDAPRIIWLMLPAGEVTDQMINQLISLLSKGDLIIDGANSFYKDTLRRGELLSPKGIRFLDIGVSGGPDGARNGACLMVGGKAEEYEEILPLIKAASAPDAFGFFGSLGSGHFVKMVHNGIEYGMMEAIAEGTAILEKSNFKLDLKEVFRVYNNRSVIESRLVGWLEDALSDDPTLANISSKIDSSGEGDWTVKTGQELGIEEPVLEDAVNVRTHSRESDHPQDEFKNKVVSAIRGKFGHHKVRT